MKRPVAYAYTPTNPGTAPWVALPEARSTNPRVTLTPRWNFQPLNNLISMTLRFNSSRFYTISVPFSTGEFKLQHNFTIVGTTGFI